LNAVVVLVTVPRAAATRVADALLAPRLAACVSRVDGVRSSYWWRGRRCRATESLLIAKTRRQLLRKLIAAVRAVHPYEVPEIVALPLVEGNPTYLAWIRGETGG